MFVDASAMVAILCEEGDARELETRLLSNDPSMTSPIAIFEASLALQRKLKADADEAREMLQRLLALADTAIEPVTEADAQLALSAHARYGKGRGHPAQLNMGECFAYAMAKSRGAALLFKGDDFIHTDIRSAVLSR
ncbi:VapC toxin family PIN domain ribonuclease [Kaistia algarum]|nr:VapC toxin family PIN domain ribonuclease [Kaistia algarum]